MTTSIALRRLEQTDFASYGQLVDAEENVICLTLELPWRDNHANTSCIPVGMYVAHRFRGKRPYDVFKLDGVPGRSDIELHIGNLPHDTEGCVLLGSNLWPINGQPGIAGSEAAFRRFMDHMKGVDSFTLVVSNPDPLLT